MSITRSPRRQTFTVINNDIINDDQIPLDSAFLLVFLLSKPDTWQVNASYLQTRFNCGRQKVYRMLRDLQDLGYASYSRSINGETDWTISEDRIKQPRDENRHNAHDEKPHEANHHVLVNTERAVNTDLSIYINEHQLETEYTGFKQMRKKKKKPMNEAAEKLLLTALKKLESNGHCLSDALVISTANSWLSVFPPKGTKNEAHRPGNRPLSTPQSRNAEASRRYFESLENNGSVLEADDFAIR